MEHLPNLISDLAFILILAGIVTLIFKKLKQPLVLGYVLVGLLVGPSIKFFHIYDLNSIKIWSEIGVIVLLFSLGLEFNFKKLIKVGGTGTITALFEFVVMFSVGYLIGKLLGWSQINRIFLGGMLTISSTTIIIKAHDELGLKTKKFAQIVLGVLIIEDLIAILQLVLFPTLSLSKNISGMDLSFHIAKLVFFLTLWFVIGIYLIPSILKWVRKLINDETLLIVSLGLCFGMVTLASSVGFSSALGAFIMGSILSGTLESEKIHDLVKPIRDLFGAIFFVSVGLLVNPSSFVEYWLPITIITLCVITLKPLSAAFGILISGQPLSTAIQSGFCLCQIGEFSFIIATMGISMNAINPELFPIIVAVSIITTFTTPYQIKAAIPFYNIVMRLLPQKLKSAIQNYTAGSKLIENESDWQKLTKKYISSLVLQTTFLIAILVMAYTFLDPFMKDHFSPNISKFVSVTFILISSAPFIYALVFNRKKSEEFKRLWINNNFNKGYLTSLLFFRYLIAIVYLGVVVSHYFFMQTGLLISAIILILIIILFSRRISNRYERMENRFLKNLNFKSSSKRAFIEDLHLASLEVSPNCIYIGQPLWECKFREKFGINIAHIQRGNQFIYIPKREEKIYPYDKLSVIGSDEQIGQFRKIIEKKLSLVKDLNEVQLKQFTVAPNSKLEGLTIKESRIREDYNLIIAGIERDGEYLMNPESSIQFESKDIVWLVTDKNYSTLMHNLS